MKRILHLSTSVVLLAAALPGPAAAINNTAVADISDAAVLHYLNNPQAAAAARYDLKDSAGNPMHLPSVIQLTGQDYRYAAVYHTPYAVNGGIRFKVNLAASNDLVTWTHIGLLVDNADMARITRVPGTDWLVLSHEQWLGRRAASANPARVAFKLFHSSSDLLSRTIRASYVMPEYKSRLNGTPSVYALRRSPGREGGVDGTFGFHYWNGTRDLNAVATIRRMFDPTGAVKVTPAAARTYNARMMALGVTGNIGDRDTLLTRSGRFNVQEGNVGRPARTFDKWRLYLYRFVEQSAHPDGRGTLTPLAPQTPGRSKSFGNPTVTVVDRPGGGGKALVVSYFLFSEGAAPGEAGSLLYYFDID